ncbi:hypothetical protein FQN57_001856 [Myotisia sp. PD_48]|nr:hypothetical protein FQN57_001856 [Myotisia sp. PD_48]
MTMFVGSNGNGDAHSPTALRRQSHGQEPGLSDSNEPTVEPEDSSKKRKRPRKGDTEKKFDCKHEGCGKSYSRAEHLYRHQLNHTPKQIYRCEFPNCYRSFVRQDLCIRHQERHTTHGSQLQKRDNVAAQRPFAYLKNPGVLPKAQVVSPTDELGSPTTISRSQYPETTPTNTNNMITGGQPYMGPGPSSSSASADSNIPPPQTPLTYHNQSDPQPKPVDTPTVYKVEIQKTQPMMMYGNSNRQSYDSYDSQQYSGSQFSNPGMPSGGPDTPSAVPSRQMSIPNSANSYAMSSGNLVNDPAGNSYLQQQQQGLHLRSMPPTDYPDQTLADANNASIASALSNSLGALDPVSGVMPPDTTVADLESMAPYALPVFGGETLNRSPFAMTDDFTAWLFSESSNTTSSSVGFPPVSGMMSTYSDPFSAQVQPQYYPADAALGGYISNIIQQQQHPMSVTSILDTGPPHSVISEEKRNELLDLIHTRFNETDQAAVKKRKDLLMEGNMDADNHILSLRMMQTYISSYWYHCHAQLPILHKPTFTADKTPNLLLLAVMAIGATTLDNDHGQHFTDMASELANFICWHLRWEIFRDLDFRPPAKLWVFQTLLLLETYEKMYSTRELHERAHIHHDTTLTLMRRGSSLIGRAAFDSPPSIREDRQNRSATGSGTNSASEAGPGDESWARWIKAEATRRVAFAAFVLDSTHAAMFGHSVKMVAHEIRLPLPCDEALWSATSAAEVARVQSSLTSNGVKPTMFLDGLKKTLNGQRVRTNSFGRTIIMAGLLSVSWHMKQRDLQVSSLGVSQPQGARDKWRLAMLRAFDNWKRDFDEALIESNASNYSSTYRPPFEDDVFSETRNVLHNLAHMAAHVDVVDCQIFAGAGRLLGRSITPKDFSSAREKMTDRWATKASARDAAFYALKFLAQVLLPDDNRSDPTCGSVGNMTALEYTARDDFLMNRPWVLYFAALVVWSYGFALDGPIIPVPELSHPALQRQDMYAYLERVGSVQRPDDLDRISDRNRCMGLLMVLRENFVNTRWELLHEAANLLGNCIEKLKGPMTNAA